MSLEGVRDGKHADLSKIRKENVLWAKNNHTHQALAQPERPAHSKVLEKAIQLRLRLIDRVFAFGVKMLLTSESCSCYVIYAYHPRCADRAGLG